MTDSAEYTDTLQYESAITLLKFSSNILQIEYQMLVLAHTDLRKYEVKMGISSHILKMRDIANQYIFHLQM